MRSEDEAGDDGIHIDAEAAADDGGGAGGQGDGVGDAGEQRVDFFVEAAAIGGEGEGSCGAVEKTDADAGLEAADGAADGGLSDSEDGSGADEASGFDDGSEHADAIQKTIVERTTRVRWGSQLIHAL